MMMVLPSGRKEGLIRGLAPLPRGGSGKEAGFPLYPAGWPPPVGDKSERRW